jgi:AcrR family transcriptional regulator
MVERVILKRFERPNSDGRRDQIVNAALKVMIAEGVYGTTTRKIAEAAGVNVATLHYHFQDKEDILLQVMVKLVADYRALLAQQFSRPQLLHDRIEDLLRFIWGEIEKAPGEQLLLQEMTIYVLRNPHVEHLALEKDKIFLSLYVDNLMTATDVSSEDAAFITGLANFVYTSIIGIFNQWLATKDTPCLLQTLANLIAAAQEFAKRRQLSFPAPAKGA